MADEIVMTLRASAPRRWLGVGVLGLLGLLLIYLGMRHPPGVGMLVVLIVIGLAALALAVKMYRATEAWLELTRAGLFSSDGRRIAPLSQIAAMDRGLFSYKPSNGFLLRLTTPASTAWAPGLWWRFGRRVGVGGVVSGAQAKSMAEIIEIMMVERDAD